MLFVNSEELRKGSMFMIYDLFGATSACQILFRLETLERPRKQLSENTACQVLFTVNYFAGNVSTLNCSNLEILQVTPATLFAASNKKYRTWFKSTQHLVQNGLILF